MPGSGGGWFQLGPVVRGQLGLLSFFRVLPVPIISMLSLSNEVVEGGRRVRLLPKVLASVREAIVVETVEDIIRPNKFVSCLFECDCVAVCTQLDSFIARDKFLSTPYRCGQYHRIHP